MKIRNLVGFLFLMSSLPFQVQAVTVLNHSFQTLIQSDNTYALNNVPDWSLSAGAVVGTWNPPASSFPTTPDGDQVLFINSGTVSQQLSANLTHGHIYDLRVAVGNRATGPMPTDYDVQLWAGGIQLASAQGQASAPVPGNGLWEDASLLFSPAPDNPALGQALEIRLVGGSIAQVAFDDVRLVAAPLPASVLLFGSSLGFISLIARRRKKTA